MSKESEFWRLIGVQPNEKFKVQNHRGKISKNTHLMELRKESGKTTLGLLSGRNKIIKCEDKIIVKYLRLCG